MKTAASRNRVSNVCGCDRAGGVYDIGFGVTVSSSSAAAGYQGEIAVSRSKGSIRMNLQDLGFGVLAPVRSAAGSCRAETSVSQRCRLFSSSGAPLLRHRHPASSVGVSSHDKTARWLRV